MVVFATFNGYVGMVVWLMEEYDQCEKSCVLCRDPVAF